jgi:hypothetical protein
LQIHALQIRIGLGLSVGHVEVQNQGVTNFHKIT